MIAILVACKTETKEQNTETETASEVKKELTIAEKIAKAHGFDHWKNVHEIQFTFNVDRGDNHSERTWNWNPKTNDVRLTTDKDTINFNRKSLDLSLIHI